MRSVRPLVEATSNEGNVVLTTTKSRGLNPLSLPFFSDDILTLLYLSVQLQPVQYPKSEREPDFFFDGPPTLLQMGETALDGADTKSITGQTLLCELPTLALENDINIP